jgi:hypothetical protein
MQARQNGRPSSVEDVLKKAASVVDEKQAEGFAQAPLSARLLCVPTHSIPLAVTPLTQQVHGLLSESTPPHTQKRPPPPPPPQSTSTNTPAGRLAR